VAVFRHRDGQTSADAVCALYKIRRNVRKPPSMNYRVDTDITVASTIDSAFYRDPEAYTLARDRIFARTWQWIGALADVSEPSSFAPRELLPGLLDEPLLLTRDERGELRCLSNVCTHRGNLLATSPGRGSEIRCGYHSRRFDLAGRMRFMPEFQAARNFPAASDHLPAVPFAAWAGHAFASLDPAAPHGDFFGAIDERHGGLPVGPLRHDPSADRDFTIAAHWALYVENYLEGFHVPFVHGSLAQAIEYASYETELYRYANLQVALARPGTAAFRAPISSSPSTPVAAYYWWVFPNLMLNFYPWGLSLNLVEPRGLDRTRIAFRRYVAEGMATEGSAGDALDRVEMEDEAIVQQVQRGVRSRFYRRGRYSPTRERGVHHFHRLVCDFLDRPDH